MTKNKTIFTALFLAALFFIPANTFATELPIDIYVIGRQEIVTGRATHRVGADLFTGDAQRVNDALAARAAQRQSVSQYLFETAIFLHGVDTFTALKNESTNLALFAQPIEINVVRIAETYGGITNWQIVAVLSFSVIIGFVFAHFFNKKRREKRLNP